MTKSYDINIKLKNGNYITKKLLFLTSFPDLINDNIYWVIFTDENKENIILPYYKKEQNISINVLRA
jgi:hypothetical protein